MKRYSSKVFCALRKAMKQPYDNVKPLQLKLTQFYDFMLLRCLDKTPIVKPKPMTFDMLLAVANTNPLSVYVHSDIAYLPDNKVTWSIGKYE